MRDQGIPRELVDLHRSLYGVDPDVVVSVPGRLDFLNTHQDYKGLPVVAMAVDRRLYVAVTRGPPGVIRAASWNMRAEGKPYTDEFDPRDPELKGRGWWGDYLRAATKALVRSGFSLDGARVTIYSRVPVSSGMASSAALTVGFIAGLNEAFSLGMSIDGIAETAYVAERVVMGIPCGRLDQYSIAYGGVTLIHTRPPVRVERLPFPEHIGATVADSGVRHSTGDIHPRRQAELDEALRILAEKGSLRGGLREKLGRDHASTDWASITREDLEELKGLLPGRLYRRVAYTVLANESTRVIVDALKGSRPEWEALIDWRKALSRWGLEISAEEGSLEWILGAGTTYQHILLSELYEVSIPALDDIVKHMIKEGMLGAKLSGAGLGGIVMALYKPEDVKSWDKSWVNVRVDEGITTHE